MSLRLPVLLATTPLWSSFSVLADDLPNVVVTAQRVAQTTEATLAAVTVIDRQQIEQSQAASLLDLLQTAGVAISNNGGLGKASSVFLRGTEADHVVVLIDGVKVGSATLGETAFEQIPLNQVERIEIVRGSRSSLYGSEAIGGVIQIFTHKGGGAFKPNAAVGVGSDQTFETAAGFGGGGENSWFSGQVSQIDSQGFNSCRDSAACFATEPDEDGYRNLSAQLRAGHRFANATEVDVHWLRSQGDSDFDGSYQNQAETVQQVLGLGLNFLPRDDWSVMLKAGRSWDEADNFKAGLFSSRFDTQRDSVSLQQDLSLREADVWTLGVDYQRDAIISSEAYALTSRTNTGIFSQYLAHLGQHQWQGSWRYDDHQHSGHHTGNLSWGYHFNAQNRVFIAYGTAFKAPSFNELYYPDFGNAQLNPEKSASMELGFVRQQVWGEWAIHVFQTKIKDLISYDAALFAPNNINRARIRGVELTLTRQIRDWAIKSDLTLLDPINQAELQTVLPRRAKRSLGLHVDRSWQKFSFGGSLHLVSQRYDNIRNSLRLAGYGRVDLRSAYHFNPAWQLQARIDNVLDKPYETAMGYNQAGRGFFLNLIYQP